MDGPDDEPERRGVDYSGESFARAFWRNWRFDDCSFARADLRRVDFGGCWFEGCDFTDARFDHAVFERCGFVRCRLTDSFQKAELRDCRVEPA